MKIHLSLLVVFINIIFDSNILYSANFDISKTDAILEIRTNEYNKAVTNDQKTIELMQSYLLTFDKRTEINEVHNISQDINNLSIVVVKETADGEIRQTLNLPFLIRQNLLDYFKGDLNVSGICDCRCFSQAMRNLDITFGNDTFKMSPDDYNYPVSDPTDLDIGETVLIFHYDFKTHEISHHHWLVNLGNNFFISKFGATGDLVVTTLEQAKEIYASNTALRIFIGRLETTIYYKNK